MTVSIKETFQLFKADVVRRLTLEGKAIDFWHMSTIILSRGVVSVLIYRVSHYLYFKNSILAKILIRLLRCLEFHYCRNELEPGAIIGGGLVLNDLGGIGISHANIIGKNCTFMGKATSTLGGMEDVNVLLDRIGIGDYCIIGHNVRIISNVSIAKGIQIKPNSVVMNSLVTEGSVVSGFPARKISVIPIEAMIHWSPLLSSMLNH